MTKITRLFISTGYYHNLVIATLKEQISLKNILYEDHLIISTKGQSLDKNLQMLKLLNCNFTKIYINNDSKSSKSNFLNKHCKNLIFDEIYVDPLIWDNSCFKKCVHINTKYFGVDEGILSYCNLVNAKKIQHVKYLLYPAIFYQNHLQNIIKLDSDIFKNNIAKLSSPCNTKYNENSILLVMSIDKLTELQVTKLVNYCNLFTEQGYSIYIKDHPRSADSLKDILIPLCMHKDKVICLDNKGEDNLFIAEQIMYLMKPKMVLGFTSTAVLAGYYLYNIPSFRVSWDLTILSHRQKEFEKILYAVPHLEDYLQQNKYDALTYCNNYSFYYLNVFKNIMNKESLYIPSKIRIYLSLFFNKPSLKNIKHFFYIIYYLLKYKNY